MHSRTNFVLATRGTKRCFHIFPGGPDIEGKRWWERKGQMKSDLWMIITSGPWTVCLINVLCKRAYVCLVYVCAHWCSLWNVFKLLFNFLWKNCLLIPTENVCVCVRERQFSHSYFNLSGNCIRPRVAFTLGWCHSYLCLFTSFSFNNPIWYKTSGQLILTNCNGWTGAENAISKLN